MTQNVTYLDLMVVCCSRRYM